MLKRAKDLKKRVDAFRARWEERFARSSRFFLLALIIACTIEVVTEWNGMIFEIDALRGGLRARAENYASIVAKASLEPVLAYDPDGLDAVSDGLFDDEEVAFVRFADHQGTTVYDRVRPTMPDGFRERYAHQLTRDVNGILQDPELLAKRMGQSRHVDFVQRWVALIARVKAIFVAPDAPKRTSRRGVVLYQDRLKAPDGGHDSSLTWVLSTIVDERGEPWGATLVAFSLEKQNAIIANKIWKGAGMLVLLVGLVAIRNVTGRREKIRQIDVKKRVDEAKEAIAAIPPSGPIIAGDLTATGALDQAEETVDGLVWDARADGDTIEIVAIDPAGEGHAVASTALHVVRGHRNRKPGAPLVDVVAALGRDASVIPLGRPLAPLVVRLDAKTGAFEAIESDVGSLRIALASGAIVEPKSETIAEVPEHVVGPLVRRTGELPRGARLVCVAAGVAEDGSTVDVARVAELVARWRGATGETAKRAASDAVAWARGRSPRLVDSDLLVVLVERAA
ncbi:MAG TPA: hypothetical protein VIF62_38845 [Labilithrix sp.]